MTKDAEASLNTIRAFLKQSPISTVGINIDFVTDHLSIALEAGDLNAVIESLEELIVLVTVLKDETGTIVSMLEDTVTYT